MALAIEVSHQRTGTLWCRAITSQVSRHSVTLEKTHVSPLIADLSPAQNYEILGSLKTDNTFHFILKCDVCTKLVNLFRNPVSYNNWINPSYQLVLGSFDDVLISTRCEIHPRMFRSVFGDTLDAAGLTFFTATRESNDHITISGVISQPVLPKPLIAWRLMLLPTPSVVNDKVSPCVTDNAIAVNQQWIDRDILRCWKQSCNKQNHVLCQQGPEVIRLLSPVCPDWVIDTLRMCLVRGSTGASYVALSYVWGLKPFFKTTRQDLVQLQLDGALTDSHRNLGVPRTITDAIATVGLLEERYLWVDALCIVHDDSISRHAEINKMAAIYAGASITIIAAQGNDANYGLRGLHQISQPRNRSMDIFTPEKGYNIVATRKWSKNSSLWSSRGWTYQESLLSRRRLYFKYDGIHWDCACSSFYEDVQANPGSKLREMDDLTSYYDTFLPDMDKLSSWGARGDVFLNFPSLSGYSELLKRYNVRNFTYPQDALSAFAGIMTALSQTFYGGFLCGLPLVFFDVALCWQPGDNMCERRLPSENKEPTELGLPSWSWVGWKCEPDPWAWDNGTDYVKKSLSIRGSQSAQQTLPIVSWFSRKWGTTETRPIFCSQNNMQELKTWGMQGREPPLGWKQFEYRSNSEESRNEDLKYWTNSIAPRYFYKHERDANSEFWYPIPSRYDTQEGPSMDWIDTSTLLCARTRRAWLYLRGMLDGYHDAISIRDVQGNWVGALRLQTPLSRGNFKMITCELVAISAGYAIEGLDADAIDEWEIEERPKASRGEKYEYYNVLWVEWKDGIAYRKALGRVMKSAWEAQDLEWIDLVLG